MPVEYVEKLKQLFELAARPFDNPNDRYAAYLNCGRAVLGLPIGALCKLEHDHWQVLITSPPNLVPQGAEIPVDAFPCGPAVLRGETYSCPNLTPLSADCKPLQALDIEISAYISTPVFVEGKLFGALSFSDNQPHSQLFIDRDIELTEMLAKLLGLNLTQEFLEEERTRAVTRMRENISLFEGAFRHAAIGMALVGTDGRWLRVNDSVCEIVGYSKEELLAIDFQSITHPDDLNTDLKHLKKLLRGKSSNYRMTKRYIHKNGSTVWVLLAVSLVRASDGEPRFFISQIEDISAQVRAEQELKERQAALEAVNRELDRLAHIDALTGLSNRRFFFDQLAKELKRSSRSRQPLSLVLMDVDYFKEYNDRFGHPEGDRALQTLADKLLDCCRETDTLGRYGGEEFALLLPETNGSQAAIVGERIRNAIGKIDSLHSRLSLSLGIANCTPRVGDQGPEPNPDILLKLADGALYRAKADGRNRICEVDYKVKPQ